MNIPSRLLTRRLLLSGLALAAYALAAARPAQAQTDFTFTVSNPNIVAAPGSTVTLNGTVIFTGPTSGQGAGIGSFFSSLVSINTDPSFRAFLFGPSPTSYTGALYDLTFFQSDPAGSVATAPGATVGVFDNSGSISVPIRFTVAPAAVPEPSPVLTFALAALGLSGLMVAAKRRKTVV